MADGGRQRDEGRWQGRPLLSGLVLVAAHGIPIAAAVATSAILSRRFHEPSSWMAAVGQWSLLLAASTVVLLIVDRASKRLLPLAALLKLSMLFPDAAPKRLSVARKSGSVRNLQSRLEEAKALGADDEPTRAAEVILALVGALHAHDRHTRGHSERVRWFTDLIAEELKLPPADRDRLRWASLLHDIGKLHVSPKILNKPGKLVRREWRHIHRHPENGARIVAPLAPWLGEWAATVMQHHERYDGTGYPNRLKGEEISLGARIVAVADAYEVMTAVRSYKKAASASTARKELTASAGSHFDPAIVRAFLNISIGRLRWVTGPVAWVAQIPFIGWVPRLAEGAAAVGGQAAGAVGTAAVLSSGSALVVGHDPIDVPADPTAGLPADVATPVDPGATPTTIATQVLGETLRKAGATPVSASSSSSPAPAPAPAPEPVVDTHDNPATQDDKVASDTTVAPPSAEHRTEPPSAGVPATDRSAPATAKQDPVTSVVDAVVPPGQLKKGA
jgi:HD-GYP domain-containing protein (c-di-GMP phosphodiesterase class II)